MKTWKNKIKDEKFGICIVKEALDTECTHKIAPISHGFVNLYHGHDWVAWCGSHYAEKRIIKNG